MGWVQLSFLVRAKRQGTACGIGPKGEARTLGLRAPLVPKAKLGHCLRAPSVRKAKLGYLARVRHWSQRRS